MSPFAMASPGANQHVTPSAPHSKSPRSAQPPARGAGLHFPSAPVGVAQLDPTEGAFELTSPAKQRQARRGSFGASNSGQWSTGNTPCASPSAAQAYRGSRGFTDADFAAGQGQSASPLGRPPLSSSGGAGGKTRTRCRTLRTGPLDCSYVAKASFVTGVVKSPPSRPRHVNKRLSRKVSQSTEVVAAGRRRQAQQDLLHQRRRRVQVRDSDDDGSDDDGAVWIIEESPMLRPRPGPAIPGHFVLPLQALVEDGTEVLLMGLNLQQ